MYTLSPLIVAAEAVDDAAAYLRVESDAELALIASLIATAITQCEAFCGQILLRRAVVEQLRITGGWQLLAVTPVRSLTTANGLSATGEPSSIAITQYSLDIDASGNGWLRVREAGNAVVVRVTYDAGLSQSWGDIDPPLRQGIIRLVAHLYTSRDSADDRGPPAAVAALWRPFRRMRLSPRSPL